MECELERQQRTCLDCNVRRIGRCEDVDRWWIGEIVADWWPYRGAEGFDGCVEWDLLNPFLLATVSTKENSAFLFINQFGCTSTSF